MSHIGKLYFASHSFFCLDMKYRYTQYRLVVGGYEAEVEHVIKLHDITRSTLLNQTATMAAIIVIKCNTVVSKWTHERCQYEIEAWYLPNYNSNNMIENLRAPGKKEKGKSNNDYDYDNGHHTNHSNQTYHVFNRLLCGVVQMRVFGNSVSHKYSSLSLPITVLFLLYFVSFSALCYARSCCVCRFV